MPLLKKEVGLDGLDEKKIDRVVNMRRELEMEEDDIVRVFDWFRFRCFETRVHFKKKKNVSSKLNTTPFKIDGYGFGPISYQIGLSVRDPLLSSYRHYWPISVNFLFFYLKII